MEDQISSLWVEAKDGEFAGWKTWPTDNWEREGGPFFMRREADGSTRCAFRATARHMNGQNHMHGGAMMTFADFSLFAFAAEEIGQEAAVTVSMNCDFMSGAQVGDLVEARGEVVRAGGSMIFLRGLLGVGERPVMAYAAVLKRVKRRS